MDTHARIAIIGGGIFGLSAAVALARDGYAHVELLERSQLGTGSTAYAAGIVSLQTWNDEDARLIQRTRERLGELVAWGRERGVEAAGTAWHPVGGLTVARPMHHDRLHAMRDRIRRLGADADVVDARELRRRFPSLRFEDDEAALVGPGDGYVESTDVVDLLRAQARAFGVRIREGAEATRVRVAAGRVEGVDVAGGGAQRADAVVLAAGARTRLLAATAGATLHALAYRTQCATLELPEADRVPVLHDTVHGFYARPESATRFLAGDGTELRPFDPDAFNPAADTAFIEATAHRVLVRFAGGDAARYRTGWAGLCVGTPDRRPLLGPAPGVGGLYVMTGDNGFGLMRGLALGDLLAASIAGRADGSATGLAVGRFNGMDPDAFPLAEGFSFGD